MPERHLTVRQSDMKGGKAKKILIWGGLGCGGALILLVLILIVIGIVVETLSPEEQEDSSNDSSSSISTPAPERIRESFFAGIEAGKQLSNEGHDFDDKFVQESVSRVADEIYGDSEKWIVSNSDISAACDVYRELGDAYLKGEEITMTDFEELFTEKEGAKRSALVGSISSGVGENSEVIGDFCGPFVAYKVGFMGGFGFIVDVYEIDISESDVAAQFDISIDGQPREELRTDAKSAYTKGFFAGTDAGNVLNTGSDAVPSPNTSDIAIRFVGDGDITDQDKSSLAEVIDSIKAGVVQVIAGSSSGSGFVIDKRGVVVTNEHVVRGQDRVGIRLTNGQRYEGKILHRDPTTDLALVQIDSADSFYGMTIGNPSDVRVGEEVLALGFPFAGQTGTSLTVTRGIVSSTRTVDGVSLLQTDAAINPGNSGGPLVNRQGQVIGVNSFRVEETTSGRPVTNIGFAVSVIELKRMVSSLSKELTGALDSPSQTSASVPSPTPASQMPSASACQRLCDVGFWENADREEVIAELDGGASINAADDKGLTPLHYAAGVSADSSVIALLLDRGADINASSNDGSTPLHSGASNNPNPAVIKMLLNFGADIHAKDNDGGTPLHYAVIFFNEDPSVIKLLLDRGADVDARTNRGDIACAFAGWHITDETVLRRLCP